jgi:DegV family protein with EDD domain
MRKQEIAVVTDSVANIPKNLIERYKIEVIPLYFRYGNKFYRDGIDITPEEVYKKVENGEIPETSQIPLGVFLDTYKRLLKNFKSIISIHLTSKLSGTYNSAFSAARQTSPSEITVFDSESALMAEGFQVLEAARAAYVGEKMENILKRLNYLRDKIKEYIAIDTFKYLQKIGKGRIPNLQALIATKLNIKTILKFKNGKVNLVKITRSRKKY